MGREYKGIQGVHFVVLFFIYYEHISQCNVETPSYSCVCFSFPCSILEKMTDSVREDVYIFKGVNGRNNANYQQIRCEESIQIFNSIFSVKTCFTTLE